MNVETRKNHTHQQERSRRQKRVSGESFGDDELTTSNYEKKMLPNSRARDLKSETTSATHGRGPR
ncbi:hypothetical protein, partial [uncultured Varibaculum sp.]|uniref:hypothetical protein n=1 Tax=uncultured Varibaculum sp. TaxID=413896 RepID=UPI002585EC5E